MSMKVLVRAPVLSQSGYGEHGRFVLRALRSRQDLFDIYVDALKWGKTSWLWEDTEERQWIDGLLQKTGQHVQQGGTYDLSLQVTIPNEWKKIAPINIGCTAGIETTKIAPIWVQNSYLMDKIIVVSEFAKQGFVNTVYQMTNQQTGQEQDVSAKGPIEVVNYPSRPVQPVEIDLELKHDFNFLAISQWSPRKNIENSLRWFLEEFIDQKVGLVLKTSLANNSRVDFLHMRASLKQLLAEPRYKDRKCSVHLIHGYMKDAEMSALYQHPKIKALVNIAHGEGFGLPLFEAAGYGLPIITVAWSGQTDFLYVPEKVKGSKKKKLMPKFAEVDFHIGPIQKEAVWEGVLQADSQWAFADQGSYKMKLRDVFKKHRMYKKRADALQEHVRSKFTEEKIYEDFLLKGFGAIAMSKKVDVADLPKISIITSVYDGDEFIRPFLEDITRQTIFEDKCELILINANSPGNEESIVDEYLEKYPNNIVYERLKKDPGVYGVWNKAIKMSSGEYITNANLDDRKAPNSLELHAKELYLEKNVDLVYSDMLITHNPNEVWEENNSLGNRYNMPLFSFENLLRGNLPHAAPMWRKSLHEKHGYFNEEYRSAGDWEMWLRAASQNSVFKKLPHLCNLYFFNPKGISTNTENNSWKQEEEKRVFEKYIQIFNSKSSEEVEK